MAAKKKWYETAKGILGLVTLLIGLITSVCTYAYKLGQEEEKQKTFNDLTIQTKEEFSEFKIHINAKFDQVDRRFDRLERILRQTQEKKMNFVRADLDG